jgi:peptidoglycan L-alanyl-D-glutamate endopeptidase CwlK
MMDDMIKKRVQFFDKLCHLVVALKNNNIDVIPVSFYRTIEEQKMLVAQGKSRTLKSKHLQWLACDLVIVRDDQIVWERCKEYDTLGSIAESLGLIWGGRWQSLNDIYHVELK